MAWAASLSANAPTESSGYRVSARPDLPRILESGITQPANESWAEDRRTADRRTTDRRATVWWSADRWPND